MKEILIRKLCYYIRDEYVKNGSNISLFSNKVGITHNMISDIVEFNIEHISLDLCIDVVEILAQTSPKCKKTLLSILQNIDI